KLSSMKATSSSWKRKLADEGGSVLLFVIYSIYAYILFIAIFDRPILAPLQQLSLNQPSIDDLDNSVTRINLGNSAATVI
ncbi:hypothetical protein PMAYCL1PPCAC_15384, partial [Pristionchus mayeri]